MRFRTVLFAAALLTLGGCGGVHVVKGGPVDALLQKASDGGQMVGSVVQGATQAVHVAEKGIAATKEGIATANERLQQIQEGTVQIQQGIASVKKAVGK